MVFARFFLSLIASASLFSYSFSVYESFIVQKKENKRALILGDLHATSAPLGSEIQIQDERDKKIIDAFLNKINSFNLKLEFLLEASKDNLKRFKETINKSKFLAKGLYFGLPLFAIENNFLYGNVHFKFADDRKDKIRDIVDLFSLLDNPFFRDARVLNKVRSHLKDLMGSHKFTEFFNEIDLLLNNFDIKKNNYDKVISAYIDNLIKKAQYYKKIGFTYFGNNNKCYFDALIDIAVNKDLNSMVEHLYTWILPLVDKLADIGFIINFIDSLEVYDNIIMFAGNNHSLTIYNFLKHLNYETIIAKGDLEPIDNKPAVYMGEKFSESELTSYFDKALEVFSNNTINEVGLKVKSTAKLSCSVCNNTQNLSICSGCHNAWYCSTDCQRKNWKNHKPVCKK